MSAAGSFLKEGAKVIILDVVEPDSGLMKKKNNKNGGIYFLKTDILNENKVKIVMRHIFERFKKIDVLFNNVGFYYEKSTLLFSLDKWRQVLDSNLTSVFISCKYAIPYMIKDKNGAVINVSSIDALRGENDALAYCVSKAGVIALTKSLAMEFARYNIRINCIAAGPMLTSTLKKWNTISDMRHMRKKVPLGRLGRPVDVAKSVLFLASQEADYITGEVLVVDGGILQGSI